MSSSIFRKTELDMPSSVIATLKQGGKQWDLVISIREFGHSSTLRGPVVKTENAGDNRKSRRSRSLASGASGGTVSKSRKSKRKGGGKPAQPAMSRGRTRTRSRSAKPAKQANAAQSLSKRAQTGPGRHKAAKAAKPANQNLSTSMQALKSAISHPQKPSEVYKEALYFP